MIPRQGSLGRFACQAWRNLTSGAKTGGSAAVVGSQLEMPGWKQLKTACNTGLAYGDRCGGSQSSTSAAAASRCLPRHHLGGSRPLATATVGQAEHAACVSNVAAPTTRQLRVLAMHSALPMVGFGIMDQTIMIQAGDLIDTTLGAKLALPTLAAAACGQVSLRALARRPVRGRLCSVRPCTFRPTNVSVTA